MTEDIAEELHRIADIAGGAPGCGVRITVALERIASALEGFGTEGVGVFRRF